jgi:ribose-phosphate pyrophosphokinase
MKTKTDTRVFYTPERYAREQDMLPDSPRGPLLVAACTAATDLAGRVVKRYEELTAADGHELPIHFLPNIDRRFSDGETSARLEHHVNGYDVFLFQSLFQPGGSPSIDQNYMSFLIGVRALREQGARLITGVLPYLAYARQDKPTAFRREPVTAKLMADLAVAAGIDRLIVWAPHCGQLRGFYGPTPVDFLDPLSLFLAEFDDLRARQDVIAVAPDMGSSKFVTHFSRGLGVNAAIASKYRPEPEKVVISEIIGDFTDKSIAVILDDMISGGGTIDALTRKLVEEKGIREVYIGVSHNLCVGDALPALRRLHDAYHLKKIVITNSIPQTPEFLALPFVKVMCLSDSLARTINRIHYGKSVSEVFTVPAR